MAYKTTKNFSSICSTVLFTFRVSNFQFQSLLKIPVLSSVEDSTKLYITIESRENSVVKTNPSDTKTWC